MEKFKKLLLDFQWSIFIISSRYESSEDSRQFNTMRFLLILFLHYFSCFLVVMGLVMEITGPLHWGYPQVLTILGAIPYIVYRLFLKSLIVSHFEPSQDQLHDHRYIKLYWLGLISGFSSFVGAGFIMWFLQNN